MRIKFKLSQQRKFLKTVIMKLNCPSLRLLNQFGLNINYSTWKSYYNENRTLPEELFNDLCHLAKVNKKKLEVKKLDKNWGQVRGGKRKKGKRK